MRVHELFVSDFRNYRDGCFRFHETLTVVVGANAAGKTNLVEALYVTAFGRVLRGRDEDAVRWGARQWSTRATYVLDSGVRRKVAVGFGGNRKEIRVDGKKVARRSDLVGLLPLVVSVAEDLSIPGGDPRARRRFLDGLVTLVEPAYLTVLREYNRALKQRNRLLAEGFVAGRGFHMLGAWTERLVELGAAMISRRTRYVSDLGPAFAKFYGKIAGGEPQARLTYVSRALEGGDEATEGLRREFAKKEKEERSRGITLVGPHLDDLKIEVESTDVRRFGSRGQAKSVALALRLAQAELVFQRKGERPVIVLDDAFSDLDDARSKKVPELVEGYQAIFTSAEERRVQEVVRRFGTGCAVVRVQNGASEAVK